MLKEMLQFSFLSFSLSLSLSCFLLFFYFFLVFWLHLTPADLPTHLTKFIISRWKIRILSYFLGAGHTLYYSYLRYNDVDRRRRLLKVPWLYSTAELRMSECPAWEEVQFASFPQRLFQVSDLDHWATGSVVFFSYNYWSDGRLVWGRGVRIVFLRPWLQIPDGAWMLLDFGNLTAYRSKQAKAISC